MAHEIFIELSYDSAATTADSAHSISNPNTPSIFSSAAQGSSLSYRRPSQMAEKFGTPMSIAATPTPVAARSSNSWARLMGSTSWRTYGAPNKSTPPIPRIPSANDMRARTAAGVRQIGWLSMQHLPRR
jgi:hypothetical protein